MHSRCSPSTGSRNFLSQMLLDRTTLFLTLTGSAASACCSAPSASGQASTEARVSPAIVRAEPAASAACLAPSRFSASGSRKSEACSSGSSGSPDPEQPTDYDTANNKDQRGVCETNQVDHTPPPEQSGSSSVGIRSTTSTEPAEPSATTLIGRPAVSGTTSVVPQVIATSGVEYSGPCSKSSPCKGQATYYDTATSMLAPSSCGWTNNGAVEDVLALPVASMTNNDCGRTVTIKYGGILKTGRVVDKCSNGCDSTSIDLSRHLFSQLADFSEGRLFGVEWWIE
ncbi:hypothetical protein BDV29DRAFT_163014 [Aspergillus leporis]|uniref:RlpA-like double-psi beta-barrel-protein domain-containing protein-containing protein n=1 Tax=Aspergillus leporis TaxID=41062 RepID=A0A5N5WH51_9EURO|nr:hypothetical protein BDV29DRAFT_163014 [Aspergillus leporis]